MTSSKRKEYIRHRATITAIVSEIGEPIEGLNGITALIFLGQKAGLPLNYEFDVMIDGTVLSDELFSDLMDLVEQGILQEEFEERKEMRIPLFSSMISGKEALEYLESSLGEEFVNPVKTFVSKYKSRRTAESLSKDVLKFRGATE